MEENKILSDAADTIIDSPVTFEITVKNKRMWQKPKRPFQITGASLGTMVKISKELLAIDLKTFDKGNILDSNYILIEKHAERMARIIAFAIVNNKADPPGSLVSFLLHNLTSVELQKLVNIVLKKIDITSFLTTIIMVKGMTIMNPTDQVSKKIASGQPSEE
jgi:hypothetical protein